MNETMEQTGALRVMDAPAPMTVTPQAATPAFLLQLAVQQGADLDRLERLIALQERWEANEARKAYVAAMSAFKSEPILIVKDKQVYFQSKTGGADTNYFHATLANVVATVVPRLGDHDLAHRWDVTRDAQQRIKVRCIVTHKLGHSESLEMDGALDNSGNKNSIQQMASTVTYLQRYSLLSILGLATADQVDDDGAGGAAAQAQPERDPIEAYTGDLAELLRESAKVLRATTTDAEALAAWKAKREQFTSVKQAYEAFKKACELHRVALKGGAQ